MELDRLVEGVELEEVEDRGEGLVAGDRHVVGRLDERRLDEEARAVDAAAAAEHLAALGLGALEGLHHVGDGGFVDERPHQDALVERIADPD